MGTVRVARLAASAELLPQLREHGTTSDQEIGPKAVDQKWHRKQRRTSCEPSQKGTETDFCPNLGDTPQVSSNIDPARPARHILQLLAFDKATPTSALSGIDHDML